MRVEEKVAGGMYRVVADLGEGMGIGAFWRGEIWQCLGGEMGYKERRETRKGRQIGVDEYRGSI